MNVKLKKMILIVLFLSAIPLIAGVMENHHNKVMNNQNILLIGTNDTQEFRGISALSFNQEH